MKTKVIPNITPNREGDFILITVPNYWGRGKTLKEAKLQLMDAGGDLKGRWRVYSVHPETYLNEYGQLVFKTGHDPQMVAEYDPA